MKKIWIILLAGFIIAGCSGKTNVNGNTVDNTNEAGDTEENADNSNQNATHETEDREASKPIEVDEKIRHPNGVNMTIEEIRMEPNYISIDFRSELGYKDDGVYLSEESKDGDLILEDDTGAKYNAHPAIMNNEIFQYSKTVMEGTLIFEGKFEESASTLTLTFNPDYSEDDEEEQHPKFVFEMDVTDAVASTSAHEDEIPESQVYAREIPSSNITKSEGENSESDISILNALNEFEAVDDGDDKILTLSDDILFDFDSDELRADVDEVIDQLVQITDETDGNIKIVGHTDSKGEDSYNQTLSEDRANTVLDALVDAGVKKNRVTSEGKGASEPVAKNTNSDGSDNPDGRQKNRRVEVTVEGFNS